MLVRMLAVIVLLSLCTVFLSSAQTVCSGVVTGPDDKPLARTHVVLLTPDRVTVVKMIETGADGTFSLTIPRNGLWVLRSIGVGGRRNDIPLYAADNEPIAVTVSLGAHRYVPGEPTLGVIGDFNLWSIPKAVPMKRTEEGVYEADIAATTDTITFRLRGLRDDDAAEGIANASYVLNKHGEYDARLPAVKGVARVVLDLRKLDHSGTPARVTFARGSARTQGIAAAIRTWWEGEEEYFAHQTDEAFERESSGKKAPDWNVFLQGLGDRADAEKDALVRSFWDLGYLCVTMKTKHKDLPRIARTLERMPATSIAWSLSPNTLSYIIRNTTWKPSRYEQYARTAMEKHPDEVVRRRVLFNEFVIAFNAERDAVARKYYNILTGKYAKTPEGIETRKSYPRSSLEPAKK
jgi:hypothetical protein